MSLLDTENGILLKNYQVLIDGDKISSVQNGEINSSQ